MSYGANQFFIGQPWSHNKIDITQGHYGYTQCGYVMCHSQLIISSYAALVDSLRRAPQSFTSLHYYSQVVYHFMPKDKKARLMRFRLLSAEGVEETGLPDENDQVSWIKQYLFDKNNLQRMLQIAARVLFYLHVFAHISPF